MHLLAGPLRCVSTLEPPFETRDALAAFAAVPFIPLPCTAADPSHGEPKKRCLTRSHASAEQTASPSSARFSASAVCRNGSPPIKNSHRLLVPTRKPDTRPAPSPECLREDRASARVKGE